MGRRKVIIDGQEVDFKVVQDDPTKLKATMAPSGDMARKDPIDRNAANKTQYWGGNVTGPTPGWVTKWSYTVPSGKKALHCMFVHTVWGPTTAGEGASHWYTPSGGSAQQIALTRHESDSSPASVSTKSVTLTFPMFAGDKLEGKVAQDGSETHWITVGSVIYEFDA